MSDAEIEDKFMGLTQATLSPKQARAAVQMLWNLEEMEDVGKIFEAILV